ncbi:MAG: DUF1836 domain-containing protein [Eubacteriales bacterium]|nr:DUF1836 domain-containing protein [Eubacteriales bacterium]
MEEQVIQILNTLLNTETIRTKDIPNIELYMDQLTTFMEKGLGSTKRYPDDKIMTKTMVNNYTKNHLFPPSNKKKYSKEHIFLLIMIYYYKNVLSIADIQHLLSPLSERYFPKNKENGITLEHIFNTLIDQIKNNKEGTENEILHILDQSKSLFTDTEIKDEEQEELSRFVFITQLCYDIFLRKQLIERLLDDAYPPLEHTKKDKKNKK